MELYKFFRKLRIIDFFHNVQENTPDPSVIKRPSSWIPPSNVNPLLIAYEKVVLSKVDQLYQKKRKIYYNFTKEEKSAIRDLRSNNSIIIKPADKGGALVIQNRASYVTEVLRQLNDNQFYLKIYDDPTHNIQQRIDTLLYIGQEADYLTPKEKAFLTVSHPIIPTIYMIPKIHKSLQNPPGRPIVSALGSLLEPLSKFLDVFLRPFVIKINSYVQDSTHINILQDFPHYHDQLLLVTLDINSLYTNIPQKEALEVLANTLIQRPKPIRIPTFFLTQ